MRIRGACRALFAFDLGFAVDLEHAATRLPSLPLRVVLRHRGRAYPMDTQSRPLRISQRREPIALDGRRTLPEVDITLFDYGAACVAYDIPLEGALDELPALSALLYDNPDLYGDAEATVADLMGVLGDAIDKPELAPLVEDYVVFRIDPDALDGPPALLWETHGPLVAAALRAATEPLSADEVRDALAQRLAYGQQDAVLIDWFAAVVVGEEMDDEVAVLEFATVELLELRVLDRQLDQGLEDAYRALTRPAPRWSLLPGREDDIGRVARLQTDAALILEGATNPAKLLGDQYLARMYRTVARRFHLPEWEAAVDRKLTALASVYQKLTDRAATRRLETLEWIIIILIAISIVIYFIPGMS
jgi:hypothetical protein